MNTEPCKIIDIEDFIKNIKIEWDITLSDSNIKPTYVSMYKKINIHDSVATLVRVLDKKMLISQYDIFVITIGNLEPLEINNTIKTIRSFDFKEFEIDKPFSSENILNLQSYMQKSSYKGLDFTSDIRSESEISIAKKLVEIIANG